MAQGAFELFQLRCFVAVAQERNFRRAAVRMNMTQPPLSRQIKLLEHGVGVTLFDRNQGGVRLTPAGESFLVTASDILQRAEAAVLAARQAERGEIGALAIGFVPSAALDFIPRIVVALKQNLPGVTFTVTEMMSYEIIEALQSGQLDLGLTRARTNQGGIESLRVVNEPFVLALPRDHPLATAETVALSDLDGMPMIGYSDERGGFLRSIHKTAFASVGISPTIVQEVSQTHTVVALVNSGLGTGLVPRSAEAIAMANTVFRTIDLPERCRSTLYLNSSPNSAGPLHEQASETIIATLDAVPP
ncbi:LysR family transcriptional regulator [Amaricoccus tamworthensis]|uniref:LysR family transcriptional regulator n=1 Tax=Amaricoccus tamworthensis TaxID=57002 RepID=UPI003C7D2467